MKRTGNNRGFTLVELLVVISIIALLLSILMPSLRKASEQARFVICKSNLHNYALAGAMYLEANNNEFPHPTYCLYSRDTYTTTIQQLHPAICRWHDAGISPDGPFWPYLKAQKVHVCPTFAKMVRANGRNHTGHVKSLDIPIDTQFSYSMNGYLSRGDEYEDLTSSANNGSLQMPKLTDVIRPSETLFITEENYIVTKRPEDTISLNTRALNDTYFYSESKYGRGDSIATFHKATDSKKLNGYSNVLFIDSHVGTEKAITAEGLKRGYSSVSYYLSIQEQWK